MPTSSKARRALLDLAPAQVEGEILELGSGWGTLLAPLAEKYSNPITGYERSPIPFLFSWIRLKNKPHVTLRWQDFFQADMSQAGLIVCYLYPGAMESLQKKEFKKDTWILSNTFAMPGWTPVASKRLDDIYGTWIYLYRI